MHIKFLILCVIVSLGLRSVAQDPVHFNYNVKKTGDKLYQLTITAKLDDGWHIYSQIQPEEAISIPTKITFNKNPLVVVSGKPKEIGKKEKYEDKDAGIVQYQYADNVDFVQVVSLKAKVKTNVSGNITYQACTNEHCLPPKTVAFNVVME